MVKDVTPNISAPIILFIYFNPIKARGPEKLCQQAKAAGISGKLSLCANPACNCRLKACDLRLV